MTCLYCGFEEHPQAALFCARCGKPLLAFCHGCGAVKNSFDAPCDQCGVSDARADEGPRAASAAARSERRIVTVVFADISGFATLSEQLDPEDVTRVVNGAFNRLSVYIQEYGGTIDKFIGDCVMVLFGAPASHEDDPTRAILCALDMQREIRDYSRGVGHDIGLSIGINTGEVLAGRVGSSTRQDYTVMGDTVNLAQRLQGQAGRGNILVGQETYRLAGPGFSYEEVLTLTVKGKKDPIRCYKVIGSGEAPSGVRSMPSLRRAFAWRAGELETLLEYYAEFAGSNPRIVALVGDAGFGKTELKDEFLLRSPAGAPPVLEIKCSSFLTESSYAVFRQTLRKILAIGPKATQDEVAERVQDLASLGAGEKERELLLSLLLGTEEKGLSRYLDPKERKDEIFRAFMGLLRVLWRNSPQIVVIIDLHWADALSKELLNLLFRRMSGVPVFVLLTFRPEFEHTWSNIPYYRQINLSPLTAEETVAFAGVELEGKPISPGLGAYLVRQSGGIPLFLRELILVLKERNMLIEEAGMVAIKGGIKQLNLPTGVRSIIGSRIDRLSPQARETLNYAAVIGRSFSLDLLNRVLPAPVDPGLLEDLAWKDILIAAGESPGAYAFKHVLFQEVIYQRVLKEDLARMHEAVAACLETMHFFTLDEQVEALAHHYTAAGNSAKAIMYLEQAGDKLARNYANEDAMRFYERTMEMLPGGEEDSLETSARMHYKIGQLLSVMGRWKEAESFLNTALDSIEKHSIPGTLPHLILLERGRILRKRGEIARAMQDFETILNAEIGDQHLLLEALRSMAHIWLQKGEFLAALASLTKDLDLVRDLDHKGLVAKYLNDLGIAYYKLGRWDQASETWKESLALKEELGDRKAVEITFGNLGEVCLSKGDLPQAEKCYAKALGLAREIGDTHGVAVNLHNLGVLHYNKHAYVEAQNDLKEAFRISEEIDWAEGKVMSKLYLAQLSLVNGATEEGYHALRESVEDARKLQLTEAVGFGLCFVGEYHVKKGDADEARKCLDEAREHARVMAHSVLFKRIDAVYPSA